MALDEKGLRKWMNTYHDSWLDCHSDMVAIRQVIRKILTDQEKIKEIEKIARKKKKSSG